MARLCLSLPLGILLFLSGCCCTPEPFPTPIFDFDAGPPVDAPFVFRDGGIFRPDVPLPDAPPPLLECRIEIPAGAACDDEPCFSPVRHITCPDGLQHLTVAAMDDGTTWLGAAYPPRLLHVEGETLSEAPLPLGEGQARLLVSPEGDLFTLYADEELAIGPTFGERTSLIADHAYFVVVGAAVDDLGTVHVAWIDDGPGLHAGAVPLAEPAIATHEVSPTYFADSALALGPDGVPHVAYWLHRPRSEGGRDLMVRDGEGAEHPIGFTPENNDAGTNVSIAASETALLGAADFADGIHLYVPDDAAGSTGYRDALVPGTAPLEVTGCPDVESGPLFGECPMSCTESGAGNFPHAHELVRLPDGRFALLWLERSVTRDVGFVQRCAEPGCICERVVTSELATTDLVFGLIDETTGMPERTMVVPLGDFEGVDLFVSQRAGRLVVAMQDWDTTATLVDIDLSFLGP